ncbi:hypothetical protein [Nitrosomonas eutropha]|uniref:hypothetical protein n=1 Tax=Nitrosomonas eutropha TaxID=916 RepID=UPI001160E118|nr:hypothetical protein [Nitrosomonas eutropha]
MKAGLSERALQQGLESDKFIRDKEKANYFFPCPTKKPIKPDAIALIMPAAHFLSSIVPVAKI